MKLGLNTKPSVHCIGSSLTKLLYVKWDREGLPWSGVPRFSKMAGILVSKLGAETHASAAGKNTRTPRPDRGAAKQALHSPGRGQQGKLPTARPRAGTQWTPPFAKAGGAVAAPF